MVRPSWPRRYTITPRSSWAMRRSAARSGPQSQRWEPNTSPATHSLCTRTSTPSPPATSPRTKARCSTPSRWLRKRTQRNRPHSVGHDLVDPVDELLRATAVADQVGDGHHQAVAGGERLEVRRGPCPAWSRRRPRTGRLRRWQPANRARSSGLGVAGPLQHAALAGLRKMTRPQEVSGRVVGSMGPRMVAARSPAEMPVVVSPRRSTETRKAGALGLGVAQHHRAEVELRRPFGGDRHADHTGRVVQEEGEGLGRGELGRHDEVALVLPVLVVDDDHDLAPRWRQWRRGWARARLHPFERVDRPNQLGLTVRGLESPLS